MNELDNKIREALSAQDAELFEEYGGEQGLMEMILDTFRGQRRWLVVLGVIYSIVFFILAIITAVMFFKTDPESTRDLIMWAMGFMFCNFAVAMLKMWYFMEMNRNAVTREVKRLELQIARLAKRLSE